jgi:hypothetical protein
VLAGVCACAAALTVVGSNSRLAEARSNAALVVAFSCKANAFKVVVPPNGPRRARVLEYHTRWNTAFPTGRLLAEVDSKRAGTAPFCRAVKIRRLRTTELVGPYPLTAFKPMSVYCMKNQFTAKSPGAHVVYAKQIVLWPRPILNPARHRIGTRLVVLADSTPMVDLSFFTRRPDRISFHVQCLRNTDF